MDCDFSPSSPHLLPNGLFSPQNRISFELLALSGLSGFSTFKGGKMLIFQGFANSRIVREFPPFSFKVRIATLTRNRVGGNTPRGFESHLLRQMRGPSERTVFLFSLKVGFERRLLAMCRWHVATAVAFPQKRNPTFSAKWQHFSEMKGAVFSNCKSDGFRGKTAYWQWPSKPI